MSSLVDMFQFSAAVSNTLCSRGDPLTALKTCGAWLVHHPPAGALLVVQIDLCSAVCNVAKTFGIWAGRRAGSLLDGYDMGSQEWAWQWADIYRSVFLQIAPLKCLPRSAHPSSVSTPSTIVIIIHNVGAGVRQCQCYNMDTCD